MSLIRSAVRKTNLILNFDWKKIFFEANQVTPEVIVIGSQKSGTTSVFEYLSLHPNILAPTVKEIDYFNSLLNKKSNSVDYFANFPKCYGSAVDKISIDVSPAYMLDAKAVSKLIWDFNPKIKIVAILRDPIERAISAWFMYKKLFDKNPKWFLELDWVANSSNQKIKILQRSIPFGVSFSDDINEELIALKSGNRIDMPIVEYGLYKQQLLPFYKLFRSDNILILETNMLQRSPQKILDRIVNFIGICPYQWNKDTLVRHFQGDNKTHIESFEKIKLMEFYAKENSGLNELTACDLSFMRNV